jgi:hypothetical protein
MIWQLSWQNALVKLYLITDVLIVPVTCEQSANTAVHLISKCFYSLELCWFARSGMPLRMVVACPLVSLGSEILWPCIAVFCFGNSWRLLEVMSGEYKGWSNFLVFLSFPLFCLVMFLVGGGGVF